jgi:hypothetical protein
MGCRRIVHTYGPGRPQYPSDNRVGVLRGEILSLEVEVKGE